MKHILILLALVFSMATANAQSTSADTQTNSLEQDFQQGDADTQTNSLEYDYTIEQNRIEAFDWLLKAAKLGDVWAQRNLGKLHEQGLGVEQNYVLAYMWFKIAVRNGNKDALVNRDQVAKKMSAEQISEAQIKAVICSISDYKNCL